MGLFDIFYSKKILFNDRMEYFIEEMKHNSWFNNCGCDYSAGLFYKYQVETDISQVTKELQRKHNYKDNICLDNLIVEIDRRITIYLYKNHRREHQVTWNKLVDSINKRFMNIQSEIDFSHISFLFHTKYNIKTKVNLHLYSIFRGALIEFYILEYIPNIPTFYTNIIQIIRDGHIIIGWKGKFLSHENTFLCNSILPKDGSLLIY